MKPNLDVYRCSLASLIGGSTVAMNGEKMKKLPLENETMLATVSLLIKE